MNESVKNALGPLIFLLLFIGGIIGGQTSNPGPGPAHTILVGEAMKITQGPYDQWTSRDTTVVAYSLLAEPMFELRDYTRRLTWAAYGGGSGWGAMNLVDRLLREEKKRKP